MRLVQIRHPEKGRMVAVVEEPVLDVLGTYTTVYDLALEAIRRELKLDSLAHADRTGAKLPYDEIYAGQSAWKLMTPFDHPGEPARCMVSGTGLTHKASAENRARMHQQQPTVITDSMRMYQWGLEGGTPNAGEIGVQPEWFFKGNGSILRAHGEPLHVPPFADDGGEEPEIAGVYIVGPDGTPYRLGMVTGNEFSDHKMERKNYLYLAPSKLRECAIGPELVTDLEFKQIEGEVRIERAGTVVWHAVIYSGERNMSHSLTNLEHHHFKYPEHCRPGDAHIHFFGADAFSFGAGVELADGDEMVVHWPDLGRALRSTVKIESKSHLGVKQVGILG